MEVPAATLCGDLLPAADEGLSELGVDDGERRKLLGVIAERLRSGVTAAQWQRRTFNNDPATDKWGRLAAVTQRYIDNSRTGRPVAEWN